jgi:hypothetical protein
MDCAPVAGTEIIGHPRARAFFDSDGHQSRIDASISCDTPALVTIDEVGDQRLPPTSLPTDTAQF